MNAEQNDHPALPDELERALYAALHAVDLLEVEAGRTTIVRAATPAVIERLVPLLEAPRKRVRRRVAQLLSQLPFAGLLSALESARGPESPLAARVAATRVIARTAPEGHPALAAALEDPAPGVRRAAAVAASPEEALQRALDDPDPDVAGRALAALNAQGAEPERSRLAAALERHEVPPEGFVRALARAGAESSGPRASAALRTAAPDVLRDEERLRAALTGPHRVTALARLLRLGVAAEDEVRTWVADPDPRVRAVAARGAEAARSALVGDPDPGVAWLAARGQDGHFSTTRAGERAQPHERSRAASARRPYGLPVGACPELARVHAAVALCHPRTDRNLGVAIRSAEAAGVREVFVVGRGDFLRGPARGTDGALGVRALPDADALLAAAREGDYQLVAIQQTPGSEPYHQADYPPRPLFVVGAEAEGLPLLLRRHCDLAVEIPIWGAIDSLNVATALTCVLFHWRAHR